MRAEPGPCGCGGLYHEDLGGPRRTEARVRTSPISREAALRHAITLVALVASVLVIVTIGYEMLGSEAAIAGSPEARTAQSAYPPPVDPKPVPPALMKPFPVVRIMGRITPRGARIRILSVRAPANATILVRCRKGCWGRSRSQGRGIRRPVRFRRFERPLRAGIVIEVLVGRVNVVGKYTRIRIRRSRRPARRDLCFIPGITGGSLCPPG